MIATSSVSIVNVNDGATGATGPQGISVTKVVEEYRLSNSSTELTGSGTGYTWSETKPDIPSGKYLWIRERTDLSNNTSSYGTAHCDIVISGLVYDVNQNTQSITSKVWQSDITNSINTYDGSTGAAIRDRVTQTEQDISGITTRVSDVETTTDGLGTRMTTAESNITQNANNITTKVSKDGVISSINQSAETIKISASKVNIEGAVTFSSFDSTLQNRLTTAESDASTAKSNASSAVSTANTASSNASSALTKVNNSIKSTTMHYLATSASSGVTTSTSGWTTTIQSITKDKPYLWTYQTITKINDTTSNTDPVISGVYGATGGKGDTGTGVTKVEQLYRTSNSTTAPAAPTSAVSSTSTSYNTWTLAMPTYNTSYPYYYICTQTTYDNGTVKWTTVSRSKALEDANSTANTANTNASNAVSTANTANTNASNAVSTANTANTNASNAVTTANQAKSKADSAASLLSTWTGDATLATTTINGGYIKTHTIESTHLATNAIMSQNYSRTDTNSPYSITGTFLDLTTGNIYTPNFGVDSVSGEAYLNGTIYASAGQIGNPGDAYWSIGTVYDSTWGDYAGLIANGNALIQSGKLTLSSDRLNSQNAGNYIQSGGYWYDFGLQVPDFAAGTDSHDQNFLYVRRIGYQPTDSTLDTDWSYLFRVDKAGNIYWNGHDISDGTFLPLSGGTVTGATTFSNNLTVSGAFTASGNITTNLMIQTNLASTSAAQLTGNANATVTHGVTGTLGVGNGGTGQTTAQNAANAFINALSTGSATSMLRDADYFISQYIGGGTSNTKYYRRPISTIWDYIEDKIETTYNITNTYRRLDDNDFDTINVTDLTAGNLIVNGAARFTNDVFADTFTGNLVGTASNAVKATNDGDGNTISSTYLKLSGGTMTGVLTLKGGQYSDGYNGALNMNNSDIYGLNSIYTADAADNAGEGLHFYRTSTTVDTIWISGGNIYFVPNRTIGTATTAANSEIVLHTGNYNSYVPKLDGTGATGSWGISVTGSAGTAGAFSSAKSVTLTGDTTGTASSQAGWSIATTTKLFTGTSETDPAMTTSPGTGKIRYSYNVSNPTGIFGRTDNSNAIITLNRHPGNYDSQIGFSSNGNIYYRVFSNKALDNTTAWKTMLDSSNYNTYSPKLDGTGASGTWGISITGNADTATSAVNVTGTVAVGNGGTGLTSSPSMLVNLGSTSADTILKASPRPGITGTLPIANGGTGATTASGAKSNIGLSNVTNNKQVKGLSSGTTSGHLVSWGSDGYTVADSGLTATSVATKITLAGSDYSASSNTITITQANLQSAVQSTGLLLMTSAERSKLASIQVSEGGTIDFSGVTASAPLTATVGTNKTVNITHNTSGVAAGTYRSVTVNTYGHVTAGTNPTTLSGYGITDAKIASGVITLGSNTITPLTASSTLDATKLSGTASISTTGNAGTATKFASAQSVTLTGDTTGTASSTGGWSIATTTRKVTSVGRLASANIDNSTDAYKNKLSYILASSGMTEGKPPAEGGILNFAWDGGKWGAQLAIRIDATPHLYLRGNNSTSWDSSWLTVLDSNNYNNYAPTKTGAGASGTWSISVTGNAGTATTLANSRTIQTDLASTSSASFNGSANITPGVTGTLAVGNGGTGKTSWAKGAVVYASDTTTLADTGVGTSGYVLKSNGASAPTWLAQSSIAAGTATKWASAQTVYVALGTASKTTSIQGGSTSAVALGIDGVLGVANGGTGASSFTANSVIMSGSSTTGAFTTRAVTNNTSASAVTANTNLITANTLAYWTGSSNLTTCSKGTFGTAATYSATTSVTSGSSALVTSGGVSTALGSYVTLSTTQTISGTKTFSAATSFTNTTASTSKSTGAVKVSGGLGVAGQVSANTAMIGDAVSLVYDSSISALCFQFA